VTPWPIFAAHFRLTTANIQTDHCRLLQHTWEWPLSVLAAHLRLTTANLCCTPQTNLFSLSFPLLLWSGKVRLVTFFHFTHSFLFSTRHNYISQQVYSQVLFGDNSGVLVAGCTCGNLLTNTTFVVAWASVATDCCDTSWHSFSADTTLNESVTHISSYHIHVAVWLSGNVVRRIEPD